MQYELKAYEQALTRSGFTIFAKVILLRWPRIHPEIELKDSLDKAKKQ